MKDISDLIAWAETKYQTKAPRVIWTKSRPMSRSGESDGVYLDGGVMLIWEGVEDSEFVWLHEFHHHLRSIAGVPDPESDEPVINGLAQRDLYLYKAEKISDFEKEIIEREQNTVFERSLVSYD